VRGVRVKSMAMWGLGDVCRNCRMGSMVSAVSMSGSGVGSV
jgi:hypothetical protein